MDQAFPTFTTDRLLFRQLQPNDVYKVYQLFSDPDCMIFDGGRTMVTINEAFQFISLFSTYQPGSSFIRWAVESRETGEFLGTGGFHKISTEARRGEIGGELLKKNWGAGIGKEALFGLAHYAFQELQFNRITAMISPENIKAKKVAEKMGFIKEGQLKDWEFWNGRYTDMDIYRLLAREWKGN
ncbi:GNAT family protein [Pullulanibacillus sp. KACC 23026]|uniref:GNAT family N-acetyltransferase n=1 Tax=Pullulanibacillus sp. KACC 23026 TaxID=3028315 RepID=UPI0023B0043E|nr:GNAT family protein [Pullulanibacillus sp. KACC 23026]WEG10879.1 GNAT family protein [Pullulanibacillus sp. KACC 23026]